MRTRGEMMMWAMAMAATALASIPHAAARKNFADECEIGTQDCIACDAETDASCECTRSDYAFWIESGFQTFDDVLETCAVYNVVEINDGNLSSTQECFEADERTQYTTSCSSCFADVVNCTFSTCFRRCATGEGVDNADCRACVAEKCKAGFINCAGFALSTCDKCWGPSIIPGLDDAIFFGIVGGVGALVLIALAVCVYCTRCVKRPDKLGLHSDVDDDDETYLSKVSFFGGSSNAAKSLAAGSVPAGGASTGFSRPPSTMASSTSVSGVESPYLASDNYELEQYPEVPDI